LEELQAQGLGIAAISYDAEVVLTEFSEKRGITLPLLSDEDSKVITEFGILNTVAIEALEVIGPSRRDREVAVLDPAFEEDIGKYVSVSRGMGYHVGTPFPGTFIVDRTGRVTSRFFEEFYRERNTMANIMLKLGTGLTPIAAVEGSTVHLKFTAYPSNPYVMPDSRISVAIQVEPNPDIHVYAPGAETMGYRVVSLNLRPVPHVRCIPGELMSLLDLSELCLLKGSDDVQKRSQAKRASPPTRPFSGLN
jgi:peroxiredoxin